MHLIAASRRVCATRWFMPAFAIFLGLAIGGAQWKGGDSQTGLTSLALFVAIAALLVLGGRSETIRTIRGDGRDERWAHIDLAATALSGLVRDHGDHRRLRVGVGTRPRRLAVRAARRDRRRRISRRTLHVARTFVTPGPSGVTLGHLGSDPSRPGQTRPGGVRPRLDAPDPGRSAPGRSALAGRRGVLAQQERDDDLSVRR